MGPWATWLQISGSILDGYEIIGNGGIPTMFFAGYIYIHVIIYIYCVYIFILKFQFGELVLFVKSFEYGHMFGEIVGKKNVG